MNDALGRHAPHLHDVAAHTPDDDGVALPLSVSVVLGAFLLLGGIVVVGLVAFAALLGGAR